MTAALVAAPALLGFWWLLCWRVRAEDGWVGVRQPRTPLELAMLRLRWGLAHLGRLMGEALLPAVRRATDAMIAWRDEYLATPTERSHL